MKICISICVMVVIVADKLMISQCWLKHKASLSCVGCYKGMHERVQVHVLVNVHINIFSFIFKTFVYDWIA